MDKEKIIKLANKGLELVEEIDRKSMYKNLLVNLFFEIRKEAINYTRSCKTFYCYDETVQIAEETGCEIIKCDKQCEKCKQ